MNIRSINSAVATDGSTVERTKPARGEHGRAQQASASSDSFQGDFKSLLNAVQSGDLTSAQSAIDSLKGNVNGTSATYSPSSTAPTSTALTSTAPTSTAPTSTAPTSSSSTATAVGADLKAMLDAVQAGDVEGAQSALKLFVSDARADGPHGGPSKANYGHSGLKLMQALHRHHRQLGLESIIASLFSSASSSVPPVDSAPSPTTSDAPVDSSTSPATDAPATDASATDAPATDAPATDETPVSVVVDPAAPLELVIQPS